MLDPDADYFPEPDSPAFISFSVSFVKLMFSKTRLDREIEKLIGVAKCNKSFERNSKLPWPAPGSEDTELGVLMEPEVGHGEAKVYTRVQA